MSAYKKVTCKGTLRLMFICLRPSSLLGFCLGVVLLTECITPAEYGLHHNPPIHIVYVNTMYLHTGKGVRRGELSQREGERGNRGEYRI
jgi:hypothetical protein